MMGTRKFGNSHIEIVEGDITLLDRDAIVNAANAQLVLGGGVAGAIRQRGGPSIQEECDRIGGTFVGGAVITGGGTLKARYVIHAVGPRMGEGDEDEKLKNATLNSLKVAEGHGLKSIAFPAISASIFGFPLVRCAAIMTKTAADYLAKGSKVETVTFCLYGAEAKQEFERALRSLP
jgi:O-acetyl-ADP-ribose deacetylase (regulator of RNase III)